MYRHVLCIFCVIVAAGCRAPVQESALPVVDLLRAFDTADKRPPSGFSVAGYLEHDIARPSILAPVPSRLTVPLYLPRRAVLRVALAVDTAEAAASVRFRIGISDARIYEGLDEFVVAGDRRNWLEVRTDLSAYAGLKWSLFYRPDRTAWRLVLATDPGAGTAVHGVWGAPAILTDSASAREYLARRERLRQRH
jgi:hypothetical protein